LFVAGRSLGPGGGSTYPNTDSYQSGTIVSTGISITDISASGPRMSFRVTGLQPGETVDTPQPSPGPSPRPSPKPSPRPSFTDGGRSDAPVAAPTGKENTPVATPTLAPNGKTVIRKPQDSEALAAPRTAGMIGMLLLTVITWVVSV
jgi:hypothetical protein